MSRRPALVPGIGSSLKGISTRINGRHAFVHERVLELIVRETQLRGGVSFNKADLAKRMDCYERTLGRAITRLRRDGLITVTPVFSENGAQMGNRYRATAAGLAEMARLKRL